MTDQYVYGFGHLELIPTNFPKIESPFVRELTTKGEYLVTPQVTPGYEWVFDDTTVLATEKLDGTDVSVVINEGAIVSVWNRMNRVKPFSHQTRTISSAIMNSGEKGYLDLPDGQWFGEVIGPKVNGNPYKLDEPMWIPFLTYVREHLVYKSWGKYPKTFDGITEWFKDGPVSLFMLHRGVKDVVAEGVVFHHPDGRMAKLRRDMFPGFVGSRHKEATTT